MAVERRAKGDIAQQVAERTKMPKAQANRVVDAVLEVLQAELAAGNEIRITGFGSWRVVETKARTGRNPRTGQPLEIKAGKRVAFSPGARLSDVVRGGKDGATGSASRAKAPARTAAAPAKRATSRKK